MPEVVIACWPEDGESVAQLVASGVPVLYVLEEGGEPPIPTCCLEDWVRMPGDDRDLRARIAALELRAALHHAPPYVDESGHLHYGGRTVALPALEARLAAVLAAHVGSVVPDESLLDAVADAATEMSSLRAEVSHLRAHLRDLHLAIRRARQGYVLLVGGG